MIRMVTNPRFTFLILMKRTPIQRLNVNAVSGSIKTARYFHENSTFNVENDGHHFLGPLRHSSYRLSPKKIKIHFVDLLYKNAGLHFLTRIKTRMVKHHWKLLELSIPDFTPSDSIPDFTQSHYHRLSKRILSGIRLEI